jgi:hypothetical protein
MVDSEFTEVKARRVDWSQAASDLTGGFVCFVKFCIDTIGVLTVGVAAVLVSVPEAREQLAQVAPWSTSAHAEMSLISLPVSEAAASPLDRIRTGPVMLEQSDAFAAQYLARRYRVADEAVRVLVAAAREAGNERQIDPLLILAVMAVESSMNPFAQSPVGAQGLMQVMTAVHSAKFDAGPGPLGALDPIANIKVGSLILSDLIRRGGSVERGLQLYVGAGNQPDDGGYASRVMAELGRLKIAAAGGVDAALAAGMRAEARAAVTEPAAATQPPGATRAASSPAASVTPEDESSGPV